MNSSCTTSLPTEDAAEEAALGSQEVVKTTPVRTNTQAGSGASRPRLGIRKASRARSHGWSPRTPSTCSKRCARAHGLHRTTATPPRESSPSLVRILLQVTTDMQHSNVGMLAGLTTRYRSRIVAAAVVLATVAAFALWMWSSKSERQALLDMPAEERRALYQDTFRAARTMCHSAETAPALKDQCDKSADLLRDFPECDAECVDFVASVRMRPVR
jgi:hypothetical protein